MESESKIPYGMPTAPPLYHQHTPSQPFHNHPQQQQYGFQYAPPPPYSTNPPLPPPPPYYPSYPSPPQADPTGSYPHPPIPPPPQAGGGVSYGLYPDLNRLQQSQGSLTTTNTITTSTTTTTATTPLRPAPYPPVKAPPLPPPPSTLPHSPSQVSSFAHLKEGETPSGYVVQWRGGEGLQMFFVQREGHVVAPKKPLVMTVYKKICVQEGAEGMIEVHGCWRLRLAPSHTQVLHTTDSYTFMDSSTNPSRVVVIQMPSQMTKRMSEDLLNLLMELTDLRKEEGGVIEKVTTGVATVYDDITHKLNSVVKGTVPNAHKNTKWIRKNTGSLVRMGGSLVAKGIHLVADHIPSNEKPQEEESPVHTNLLNQLKVCKKCLEDNTVTYVN